MTATLASRVAVATFVAATALAVFYFYAFSLAGARAREVYAALGEPQALLQRAQAAIAQEPPDFARARSDAAAALRADPLARDAHKTLAQVLAQQDEAAASAMWRAAARFARDGEAQIVALQQALVVGDYAAAVDRVDILFRGQGQGQWTAVSQLLMPILQAPDILQPLTARLDERPPWRATFLGVAAARLQNLDTMRTVFLAVDRRNNRLTDDEARPLLDRLVAEGRLGDAYAIFLSRLPVGRLEAVGYLYNGDFRHPVTNLPFDWTLTRTRDALIEVRRSRAPNVPPVLQVDFFGTRIPFRHVRHLLALPPGSWRFRGLEHAVALNNPRGLRWRLGCVGRPDALAQTNLLAGDVEWRPFAVDFDVPIVCPFQQLELELPARVALEMEISGRAAYMDMAIEPRPQTTQLQ